MTSADRDPTRPPAPGSHIVYVDPTLGRPVSQYSPEGEIQMMGEFAAGLGRRGAVSRPMGIILVLLVLAPIALGLVVLITGW